MKPVTFEQLQNLTAPYDAINLSQIANRTLRKDVFFTQDGDNHDEVDDRFELIKELHTKFNIIPSKDQFERLKNETNGVNIVDNKIINYLQPLYP
jgi:hypothetical protein